MRKRAIKAVAIVTAVIPAYTLLGVVNAPYRLMAFIFTLLHFLVAWMVWNVLADDFRKVPELAEGGGVGFSRPTEGLLQMMLT